MSLTNIINIIAVAIILINYAGFFIVINKSKKLHKFFKEKNNFYKYSYYTAWALSFIAIFWVIFDFEESPASETLLNVSTAILFSFAKWLHVHLFDVNKNKSILDTEELEKLKLKYKSVNKEHTEAVDAFVDYVLWNKVNN